jgi:hypothetical protein
MAVLLVKDGSFNICFTLLFIPPTHYKDSKGIDFKDINPKDRENQEENNNNILEDGKQMVEW